MILRARIIAVIVIVLLVSVGVSTVIALNLQSKRVLSSKINDVEVLSNIIVRGIENAMAKGASLEVQKVMVNIGQNPEIMNLRVISSDGYILKSKRPEEIGQKSKDFDLFNRPGDEFKPVIRENTITHFAPIANKSRCYGCHSEDIPYNGIIEVKYDFARSKADVMAIKRFLILSNILTVLIVAAILGAMVTKMVMVPLGKLLGTIKSVESGDWSARVKASGSDELGTIGRAFDRMLDELRELYEKSLKKEKEISKVKMELDHKLILEDLNAQLQYKVKEVETANRAVLSLSREVKSKNIELEKMVERLKAINEVGRMLASIIETDELIKLIIKTTAEMLNVEKGAINVVKGDSAALVMRYHRGTGIERDTAMAIDINPLYRSLLEEGRPILTNAGESNGAEDGNVEFKSAIGVPLKMKGQIIGGMLLEQKSDGTQFTHDELDLLGTMANQAMVAIENAWLYETVKANYFGTIQSLVNALEASDRYTKGHSERVRYLGIELAKQIGMDYKELEAFEHAAILHDIGKIGIDSSVLNKEEKLTSREFSLIRAHPIIGDEILGPIGTLEGVRTTILQHHERYDGAGYPYGIAGEEISLKARILAVIDTFDAMVTDRPYRRGFSVDDTLEELRLGAGTQFDPAVVNAFLEMVSARKEVLQEAGYGPN